MKGWAEKGSKKSNLWMGASIPYFLIDFEISRSQESWNLRPIKAFGGRGWLGRRGVERQLGQIIEALTGRFRSQGVLIGVAKSWMKILGEKSGLALFKV